MAAAFRAYGGLNRAMRGRSTTMDCRGTSPTRSMRRCDARSSDVRIGEGFLYFVKGGLRPLTRLWAALARRPRRVITRFAQARARPLATDDPTDDLKIGSYEGTGAVRSNPPAVRR